MNNARAKFFDSVTADNSRQGLRRFAVAAQFKAAMLADGVSQQDLADALHKDAGQISRQLSGSANMTVDTMYELADALGKDLHIVVGDICQKSAAGTWLSMDFSNGATWFNTPEPFHGTHVAESYSFDRFEATNQEYMDIPVASAA
ncbi:helix-turn-helix domain-containing protein [Caballeronia sordidicola]|uniref:helix-turn-helix domain-containing protein n=1 Tax=Caballeronia sordidicola TaxID=196367 RepID=UPI00094CD1DE|nr:helix-turn-helix transcriptional regulator [Caballeronia sordidicola]